METQKTLLALNVAGVSVLQSGIKGDIMPSERKTEVLFRQFLQQNGYYDDPNIVVEEQKSDSPKIAKLLKHASKKGSCQGYPEYIVTSKANSEFIIVVECKADTAHHVSEHLDKYADYAVDGALLYASFLAREFDVLAIAVSGQTPSELRISQYVQLKGLRTATPYFGDRILRFERYYDGLMHSNIKFNQDYSAIIKYTKALNEELHGKKIKESQRALLISGILIALRNEAFKAGYRKHRTVKSLVKSMLSTINSELDESKILSDRIAKLKTAFAFIGTNTSLTEQKNSKEFVENLITNIDQEINGFMKTHRYVDTVSQFYTEFLRYANSDKGLGIVLTPYHVCDLFAELAEVNKDSVVYDNCCGTGSFLVSAMKKMMKDANGDTEKEDRIKLHQLVGVEFQEEIYALAVSNMIIHLDGKTNVNLGDCFEYVEKIRQEFSPNVGLLNPPYRTEKTDTEELEYVLNNLDTLKVGGKCVAIVPFSCVNDDTTIARTLKKRILAKHTLEAVMSMPEDLFHDSKIGVITCALVITAHTPHPKGKKTWFGYWRNDGFLKVKNRGRIDFNHTWEDIKTKWVNAYRNREIIDGFSLAREVNENDEWCAEHYMQADYSRITPDEYEQEVKKYVLFNLMDLSGGSFVSPKTASDA
jgi:type I restriction-modification system DNA methylase subunit